MSSAAVVAGLCGFGAEVDAVLETARAQWNDSQLQTAVADVRHSCGRTRLMYSARMAGGSERAAERVHAWLTANPSVASVAALADWRRDGGTALEFACLRYAPAGVVEELAAACPDAAGTRHGGTALGCALGVGCDVSVVRVLLRAYPGVASVPSLGSAGREALPLTLACYGASVAVVRELYSAHPQAIRTADTDGRLPLHECCSW